MNRIQKLMRILLVLSVGVQALPAAATGGMGGMGDFIGQQIANQVSRTTSAAITKNLSEAIFIPQLRIRNVSGTVKDLAGSGDMRLLSVLHHDNSLRVWDFQRGVQRPVIYNRRGGQFTVAQPLSAANLIAVGREDGAIHIFDVLTGRIVQSLDSHDGAVISLAVTPDENLLLAAYADGKIGVWNLPRFLKVAEISAPYGNALKFIAVLPDGKTFVSAAEDGVIDVWDLEKGAKLRALPKQDEAIRNIWVNAQAPELVVIGNEGTLQRINTSSGQLISQQRLADEQPLAVAVNGRFDSFAYAAEEQGIKIANLADAATTQSIKSDADIQRLKFINKGAYLLGADADGVLHVWDVRSAEEILKMISTAGGWTVIDNHGRFDSSEAGMRDVSWAAASKDLPLDHFSGNYYEPGLLTTYLSGEKFINAQPRIVQQGITLPPDVKIILPGTAKAAGQPYFINVEALDTGGGIADIRLYHNGKIVAKQSLTQTRDAQTDGRAVKVAEFKIVPETGRNTFRAVVTNTMGIEAQSEPTSADFGGAQQAAALHVVTVGINRYSDNRLNLNYSVADAQSIAKMLSDKKLASFKTVEEHALFDAQATKQGIIEQFKQLSNAPQHDVLAVYFAGHGITIDGKWYFMPYETTLQFNEKSYAGIGISADELQELFANLKMQSIFIMVDACYSGASLTAFRKMLDSQRHFSRALSKSVGLVILTATRQDQQAAEIKELGHGLFTYAVTEGLAGQADFRPRNRQISAHEVADFSTLRIPSFSKQYLQASQEPTAFTMGNDFMLLQSE